MTTISEIFDLKKSIELAMLDFENNDVFRYIINQSMETLNLKDEDFAHEYGMSIPSARRWRNGYNAPHPVMRKHVYAYFIKSANKALAQICKVE
jgi:hypothetical protein